MWEIKYTLLPPSYISIACSLVRLFVSFRSVAFAWLKCLLVRRKAGSVPDEKPLVEAVCEERIDVTSVTQHGTPGQESVKSG